MIVKRILTFAGTMFVILLTWGVAYKVMEFVRAQPPGSTGRMWMLGAVLFVGGIIFLGLYLLNQLGLGEK